MSRVMAAIDVGTNSTRLLIQEEDVEILRRSVVTGLGRGVSGTGKIGGGGWRDTLDTLIRYRRAMDEADVEVARAVITAVGRDAANAGAFVSEASEALGIPLEIVTGEEEAALSRTGATADLAGPDWTVVDIGGGSTEIIGPAGGASFGVGSVMLTDRYLEERPVDGAALQAARDRASSILGSHEPPPGGIVGVAGTWTSLAAMTRSPDAGGVSVHQMSLESSDVREWIGRLALLSVEETARLPGLDPARAPVILGGAIVASAALEALGAESCLVSERDLLDGVVAGLTASGSQD